MTSKEQRIMISVWCVVAIVFLFLAGFLVSDASWFQPARVSLLRWLNAL